MSLSARIDRLITDYQNPADKRQKLQSVLLTMSRLAITTFFSQPLTANEIAQKKGKEEQRHREAVRQRRSSKEKEEGRKRKPGKPKKEQPISLEDAM
jgi:hypothetical protein